MNPYCLTHLSDGTLLRDLAALVARDRKVTAALLAHLAEVDARRLYAPAGYPSMYAYCVEELRMSDDSALKRIQASRAVRDFPALLDAVADGRLHLTGVCLLAPHLTRGNAQQLMGAALGKSKAEIQQLVAERYPSSEAFPLVEVLPTTGCEADGEHAPAHVGDVQPHPISSTGLTAAALKPISSRTKLTPIAPGRFALHVTVDQATLDRLHRAQDLLSHRIPSGSLTAVLDRVLQIAIERLEKRKLAASRKHRAPKSRSGNARHVPKRVKDAVWRRDGGRCSYVSDKGRRCSATRQLEFDHAVPVARGGQATSDNIRLRCRTHNQYEAERALGIDFMRHKRREASEGRRTSLPTRAEEIIPGLRHLGFSADESRRAAAFCERMSCPSLEERFRAALSFLRPKAAEHARAVSASP